MEPIFRKTDKVKYVIYFSYKVSFFSFHYTEEVQKGIFENYKLEVQLKFWLDEVYWLRK